MGLPIKEFVDNTLDVCDSLQRILSSLNIDIDIEIREAVRWDLTKFLLALSASDKTISYNEVEFINYYLDYNMTIEDIKECIQYGICIENISEELPDSLLLLKNLDEKINSTGVMDSLSTSAETVLTLYEILGKEFIACDDEVDIKESMDLSLYITNMKSLINDMPIPTPKTPRLARDYSVCCKETQHLMEEADMLFDCGEYDEAKFVYHDAESCNSKNDTYELWEALLGSFKCDVYKEVQFQYFPAEQGLNQVAFMRSEFKDQLIYMKKKAEILGYENFDLDAAKLEIEKLSNYYENSYSVYLSRKKNSSGFFSRMFS